MLSITCITSGTTQALKITHSKLERRLTQHGEPQQKQLLRATLWLVCALSLAIGLLNVINFEAWLIASFNFFTLVCAGLTLGYLHRGGDLYRAAWVGTGVILINLAAFLWVAAGGAYSLIWITVVPPFTYFLLGRRNGTIISLLAFSYVIFIMLFRIDRDTAQTFTQGAFLNVTEVLIAHLLLFLYYERSRRDAYHALAKVSETDKLTGLYNRQKLDDLLTEQIEFARKSHTPLVAVLADIDFFKAINDGFGHLCGDQVLQSVANQLALHLRQQDHVGRWGGEEFLLVLPGVNIAGALTITERIRLQIERSKPLGHHLTMSFGLAALQTSDTPTELVARADNALYAAKKSGRNCCISSPTLSA